MYKLRHFNGFVLKKIISSIYRICSRNLRTFFPILAAEKSGYVKYADFFLWRS